MENFEKTHFAKNSIVLLDYTPAEIKKNKEWFIVYYAKNPITQKLERKRHRVPPLSNTKERERVAKRMVVEINKRLDRGWSPFFESQDLFYAKFSSCTEKFIRQTEINVENNSLRPDTLRSYKSFISVFNIFLKEKSIKMDFIIELNKNVLVSYLDYILYERKCSNKTYNNHLRFFNTFCNWLIERNYIKENFTTAIKSKPKNKKKRTVISTDGKKVLQNISKDNKQYYALMMVTYYCMIRRTEITKLRVSNINLEKKIISITGDQSKNKKDETVTIPEPLLELLHVQIENSNSTDFVFSADGFKPGKNQLNPKKISDTFAKYRKEFNLPDTVQFYSLKDTGITDLFNAGIPSIKIRNQARHYDIKITEIYAQRDDVFDESISNSKITF